MWIMLSCCLMLLWDILYLAILMLFNFFQCNLYFVLFIECHYIENIS